jgi:hypothetical protein
MPFGLKSAPFTFQRAMDHILMGIQPVKCQVYLDDIIIFSSSFKQHIADIREVFDRIREAGMFCAPKKCFFGHSEVKYLGHVISREGIRMNPEKIEAVTKMQSHLTKSSSRAFWV